MNQNCIFTFSLLKAHLVVTEHGGQTVESVDAGEGSGEVASRHGREQTPSCHLPRCGRYSSFEIDTIVFSSFNPFLSE